ncbi:PepSY domain-containing protein [Breoghania sp.]|uniref:PepSY domain-containing protein n=1 Tax=Breoghania sp. TaxID=2065378 RepID=UPI002AA8B0AE|nr:PepSY domain-containing protein [Breoghania sp.]
MIRPLHRWVGLVLALFVSVTALSGAVLALYPAAETYTTSSPSDMDLGSFAARVQAAVPGLEQIRRSPTGKITAFAFDQGQASQWTIDPASAEVVAPSQKSATRGWLVDLHRAFLVGDAGRYLVGFLSLAMAVLSLSGFVMSARRLGGWRKLFAPIKGPFASRWHMELGRVAGGALLFSALSGMWLFANSIGVLPKTSGLPPLPAVSGTSGLSPADIAAFKDLTVEKLTSLTFPRAGNLRDVFTLAGDTGSGYVDQGTGQVLAWAEPGSLDRFTGLLHALHTGEGAAIVGLILALAALCVPLMSLTGVMLQAGRLVLPSKRKKIAARSAQTVILVGSEGGTTYAFANRLAKALSAAGSPAHVGDMKDFEPARYQKAERILLLAATSGDGDCPASAQGFLTRLSALATPPAAPVAVLGFGDSSFAHYCAYGHAVADAVCQANWVELMPLQLIDNQSQATFTDWVERLGEVTGLALSLDANDIAQELGELKLVSRRDYGSCVQAPAAILRFDLPHRSLWQKLTGKGFGAFQAGDLIGVVPQGDTRARYYSLASASQDGFLEICVRKQPGGLCSGQLSELEPGQTIRAFLRPNPAFHMASDGAPVILIGAGTGIAPLAGFARANTAHRPLYLYFGVRSEQSELLYGPELARWQKDGRLAATSLAYSRSARPAYVQDVLRRDGEAVRKLIADGARIMVCGGRGMAAGVREALSDILSPLNLEPATLKAEGRYVEDVY